MSLFLCETVDRALTLSYFDWTKITNIVICSVVVVETKSTAWITISRIPVSSLSPDPSTLNYWESSSQEDDSCQRSQWGVQRQGRVLKISHRWICHYLTSSRQLQSQCILGWKPCRIPILLVIFAVFNPKCIAGCRQLVMAMQCQSINMMFWDWQRWMGTTKCSQTAVSLAGFCWLELNHVRQWLLTITTLIK